MKIGDLVRPKSWCINSFTSRQLHSYNLCIIFGEKLLRQHDECIYIMLNLYDGTVIHEFVDDVNSMWKLLQSYNDAE